MEFLSGDMTQITLQNYKQKCIRLIAKGKYNARPKKSYLKMIYRWAEREELEWCIR